MFGDIFKAHSSLSDSNHAALVHQDNPPYFKHEISNVNVRGFRTNTVRYAA